MKYHHVSAIWVGVTPDLPWKNDRWAFNPSYNDVIQILQDRGARDIHITQGILAVEANDYSSEYTVPEKYALVFSTGGAESTMHIFVPVLENTCSFCDGYLAESQDAYFSYYECVGRKYKGGQGDACGMVGKARLI